MPHDQTQSDEPESDSDSDSEARYEVETSDGTILTEVTATDREAARKKVFNAFEDEFLSRTNDDNQAVCKTNIGGLECYIGLSLDDLVSYPANGDE